ncbi:ABC transporter permease [Sporosarcina thermotolerans]|uniref:ABC transporter permease n=1 Tax=Sporosarcina thermotolerans TaxID=633404 RepID=A0AAW9AFA3_9BACL|nr:ABC transporter permease [Sporosarcina thermotolerans]MDW0117746.1 ABC transporter permease [Sporosarcina thermotolerans]WHT49163.1 ABC transporter permease [Sporosarcina thermotolerans]
MTLYDVVLKNIKYNIQKYFIYIASLTFSVLIYFTFVSLQYNEQIGEAFAREDKMGPLLTGVSVLLSLFIMVFVWYSNAFFITNRKQEIGLYSLVGGTKKEIGKMLFYENMSLGILALVIGIGLGQLFSTFFSMILLKVMGFTLVVHFSIQPAAIAQTSLVFLLVMSITSLQGYLIAYRFNLIELFQAKQKVQQQWKPSYILAILAVALISFGYWSLLHAVESKSWADHFGRNFTIILAVLVIGSYFLFHTGSGFLVHVWQKRKKSYQRWKNLLTLTQLKSRLRSNGLLLTVISVLNAVTLVAFGFAYTIYFNTLQTLEDHVPFSYQFSAQSELANKKVTNILGAYEEHPLIFDETFEYLTVPGSANGLDSVPGGFHYYRDSFLVLSISTYNLLAEKLERSPVDTIQGENETVILGRNFIGSQKKDENVGTNLSLVSPKGELPFHVIGNKVETLFSYNVQPSVLIVNDSMYEQLKQSGTMHATRVIKVGNQKEANRLTDDLKAVYEGDGNETEWFEPDKGFYSFSESYQTGQSIYGLLIFVFGFMGLVFLVATGSVIYFKTLTEAAEDRKRYEILRKIGLSRKKVKALIARQTFLFFLLPLLVGITHSCIILAALSYVMDINFIYPVSISVSVYTCLYGLYYQMTVATANKLVNS